MDTATGTALRTLVESARETAVPDAPVPRPFAGAETTPGLPTLPELLGAFRDRRQLSMQAASALVPVAKAVWRTWERDGVIPAPDNLARLSEMLGVTQAWLRRVTGPDLVRRAHACACGLPHGLAALRTRAGLTSRELARLVHVSPSTITRWESGERACGWQDRDSIARALGLGREEVDAALGPLPERTPHPCPGLRHERTTRGMSRAALAERLGVDAARVRGWERSGAVPARHVAGLQEHLGQGVFDPPPAASGPIPVQRPLVRMRVSSGLSPRVIAARVGVSTASLYSWERGARTPDWHHLRRLARVYRRPVAEVFTAAGVQGPRHLRPLPWPDRDLPALLVELRRWSGHTQLTLARALGVHASTVASWERGRNVPSARARDALARWLTE